MERAEELRRTIANKRDQINQGVSLEIKERMEAEIERHELELEELENAPLEPQVEPVQALELDEIDGIPIEALIPDEDARGIVKIKFQSVFASLCKSHNLEITNLIKRHMAEIDGFQERETQLQRQNDELQKEYNMQAGRIIELESGEYESRNYVIKLEEDLMNANNRNAEIEQNRQNAVAMLEEEREAHEATKSELERLKSGHKFTEDELREQAEQARQKFINSRIKVTNIRWEEEIFKKNYLAELATTGETITIPYLNKGGYLEVTIEEAQAIREEYERMHISPPELEIVAEDTFQEEDSTAELLEVQQDHEPEDSGNRSEDARQDQPIVETFEEWATREIRELKVWKASFIEVKEVA